MPSRLAIAMYMTNTGLVSDTAATWNASCVWPTKNVSAMLYTTSTSDEITVGTAICSTAFLTGAFSNTASFWFIEPPFPFCMLANY